MRGRGSEHSGPERAMVEGGERERERAILSVKRGSAAAGSSKDHGWVGAQEMCPLQQRQDARYMMYGLSVLYSTSMYVLTTLCPPLMLATNHHSCHERELTTANTLVTNRHGLRDAQCSSLPVMPPTLRALGALVPWRFAAECVIGGLRTVQDVW